MRNAFKKIARRITLAALVTTSLLCATGRVMAQSSASKKFVGEKPGQEWDLNGLKMKFCWCPPGKFTMGSPKEEKARFFNENQVSVTLTQGFWLGKYEVTQAQWQQVMGKSPSAFSRGGRSKDKVAGLNTSNFPVEQISWEDATEFCRKLTKQERKAGRLPSAWEYRLPTEAQWEYACRAGTTTATAFGNKLGSRKANFIGNLPYNGAEKGPYLRRTAEVGSYKPNAWNLHDMHGNVFEWCRDCYKDKLPGGTDPEVTAKGLDRVSRGAGWYYSAGQGRCASRTWFDARLENFVLGFRLASVQSGK